MEAETNENIIGKMADTSDTQLKRTETETIKKTFEYHGRGCGVLGRKYTPGLSGNTISIIANPNMQYGERATDYSPAQRDFINHTFYREAANIVVDNPAWAYVTIYGINEGVNTTEYGAEQYVANFNGTLNYHCKIFPAEVKKCGPGNQEIFDPTLSKSDMAYITVMQKDEEPFVADIRFCRKDGNRFNFVSYEDFIRELPDFYMTEVKKYVNYLKEIGVDISKIQVAMPETSFGAK